QNGQMFGNRLAHRHLLAPYAQVRIKLRRPFLKPERQGCLALLQNSMYVFMCRRPSQSGAAVQHDEIPFRAAPVKSRRLGAISVSAKFRLGTKKENPQPRPAGHGWRGQYAADLL